MLKNLILLTINRISLKNLILLMVLMDLKVMPKSYKGHKYIPCIIDEVTNFLIIVPIHQAK